MEEFELIKTELSKFNRDQIISAAITRMVNWDKSTQQYPFWDILTLIGWAFEYSTNSETENEFSRAQLIEILNRIGNLMGSHDFANFEEHGFNIFKVLAYQQFRFQQKNFVPSLVRSLILFGDLAVENNNFLAEIFEENLGFSCSEFCEMLFILCFQAFQGKYEVDDVLLSLYDHLYPDKGRLFLSKLTLETSSPLKFVEAANRRVKSLPYQVFDNETFFNFPILNIKERSCILYLGVLTNTANSFIYNYLKTNYEDFGDKKDFGDRFGKLFEKYVEKCLVEANIVYETENVIKNRLRDGKVIDFYVNDLVFVECKAIELKANVSIYPNREQVSREIKDSISKAYSKQLLTVAKQINYEKKERFGVIITFRDLFLGSVSELWKSFMEEKSQTYLEDHNLDISYLPPENVFILSISEWEGLLYLVSKGIVTMKEVFQQAKQNNQSDASKKFQFIQHMEKWNDSLSMSDFLKHRYAELIEQFNPHNL